MHIGQMVIDLLILKFYSGDIVTLIYDADKSIFGLEINDSRVCIWNDIKYKPYKWGISVFYELGDSVTIIDENKVYENEPNNFLEQRINNLEKELQEQQIKYVSQISNVEYKNKEKQQQIESLRQINNELMKELDQYKQVLIIMI